MTDVEPPKASAAGQAGDCPASAGAGRASGSAGRDAWGRVWPVWADHLLAIPIAIVLLVALSLAGYHSYLLFHSLAELFSIVVACSIFLVVWNMRRQVRNSYLLWVGIAYLFVAVLDGVHTLSYKGMGVFAASGSNLATELWIAARYLESLSLLVATFFIRRRVRAEAVLVGYGVVTLLVLLSIFQWDIFPHCFEEGAGLTPFKVVSEYVVCGILVASVVQLLRHRSAFDPGVLGLVIASVGVTIVEEVAFTLYTDPYGPANFIGHCLKILSFYLIYRALVHTALVSPYSVLFRDLKRAQNDLERTVGELERSNADLAQFARVASHDLRAPLALVCDYLGLLERGARERLSADHVECIDAAQEGVRRMQALIDDLLAYARLDSHSRPFEAVASSEVVEAALAALRRDREEAGAEVTVENLPLV
ncbi:MAG: MASE3 domain-containing protein, partial [Planctomycetota bacterium]